ncbi:hydrogenase 3 maturation endopeptidase HyCI [Anaerobaca lacustris]|uniref:Hydrogenase 3 maturation endopeptidase HyCI n=1 Tax=Anaerobaca lacustris TaxID=3044600 RepID=A0AAW6U3X9_9BACT|nr:hydrogenase 3 maturation endopeptidase HyCI [Sedimentisphaerales bacterium M17dextr]
MILGVGSMLMGDDAAGPLICERMAGRSSAVVIDAGTVPENYIGPIRRAAPDVLLVVDAVDFGGVVGRIRLFEPGEICAFAFGTHALSLHLFLQELGRERPLDVRLIGIQPGPRELGGSVSSAVQKTIELLAAAMETLFQPSVQP